MQAIANKEGHACRTRYFSLDYIEWLPQPIYNTISSERLFSALMGEWLFAHAVSGRNSSIANELEYLSKVNSMNNSSLSAQGILDVLNARALSDEFISRCLLSENWSDFDIVGFSTSFQQNMASLALAKAIKEVSPLSLIIFGGSNCDNPMGATLIKCFPFIDIVFSGEAEKGFSLLLQKLSNEESFHTIAGTVVRSPDGTIANNERPELADLDSIPAPSFDDFFEQHSTFDSVKSRFRAVPIIETSRGCWWGERHHCTFCGLNGSAIGYRKKNADIAFQQLQELLEKYGSELLAVDNIFPMNYFETLIPKLIAHKKNRLIHFECKSNLTPMQIQKLAAAGIRKIQPGIESLDSEVLALILKGCNLITNIQTLKLCAESGVYVDWNFLYGIPGESRKSYQRMTDVIKKIHHLSPPGNISKVRADRFSPYFNFPGNYSISVSPGWAYKYIYDLDDVDLQNVAYHFDIKHSDATNDSEIAQPAIEAISIWQKQHIHSSLVVVEERDRSFVTRKVRGVGEERWILSDCLAGVYNACWRARSTSYLQKLLSVRYDLNHIEGALDELRSIGLLVSENDWHIALALRQPGLKRAPIQEEIWESYIQSHTFLCNKASSTHEVFL